MSIKIEPDKVYVSLEFMEFDFDPQRITEILGVEPTRIKVKGKPWLQGHGGLSPVPSKVNLWAFASKSYTPPKEDQDTILSHLRWMLAILKPKKEALKSLGGTPQLAVVANFYQWNSVAFIPPDVLHDIADLGLHLYLDIYSFHGAVNYLDTEEAKEDLTMRLQRAIHGGQDEDDLKRLANSLAKLETPFHKYDTDLVNLLEPNLDYLSDEEFAERFDTVIKTLREVYVAIDASQILRERIK